ncbi:cartilage matrix protein-like isoform X1 [Mya arenaria]|uniref:cartilage matrix protein-like isoform X1 n=1 Tax=Mya arenaria TaxID=6604 RepID=UPI0022E587D6|nr:cartilage matrix protein-like isoform X1 [Mya arenaria]
MEFFNGCDLWPTQNDINRSFDAIYRGSRNTAEVVFALDCSTSTGVVGFHSLIKFVKELVSLLDVAPDRTRVAMVPYNEAVFTSFPLTAHTNKKDLLEAISKIKLWHGLTRTDIALDAIRNMLKASRPGVQKIGIVITDGRSTEPEKTSREAQLVHEMGVQMFAIGIGNKTDENELQTIATNPDCVFRVLDVKELGGIRRQIERRFCLDTGSLFAPIISSDESHLFRPVSQSPSLELVWNCYPPEACGLAHARRSRWIRPVVKGQEAWALLDDNIMRATGMRACLKLVIKARLHREGYVTLPSDVTNDVEHVTSEVQALHLIEKYIESQKNNIKIKQNVFV